MNCRYKINLDEETHKYTISTKEDTIISNISVTELISNISSDFNTDVDPETLHKWEELRILGTKLHKNIENYYNRIEENLYNEHLLNENILDENILDENFESFIDFKNNLPNHLIPFASEYMVSNYSAPNRSILITGSIDMIYHDVKENKYILCDWKRTSNINTYGFGKHFKYPFNDLDESKYNKYMIQLNIYRILFELDSNIDVSELWIVKFFDNKYEIYKMEIYDKMEQILKVYGIL